MISIFLKKYQLGILGIFVGGSLGYAYYHFVGCTSGTCAITSKPFNSTAYGMLMGFLMFTMFQKQEKKQTDV